MQMSHPNIEERPNTSKTQTTKRKTGSRTDTVIMKKIIFVLAAIGIMATFRSEASLMIKMNGYADKAYTAEGGGPFNVTLKGSDTFNGVTLNAGTGLTYTTFCLEFTEHFNFGGNYAVKLNYGAKSGGAGGGVADPKGGTIDPLSVGTAWLYRQWADGNSQIKSLAGDLQKAIWYLESEKADSKYLSSSIKNLLEAEFGSIANSKANASVGYLGVYALNLGGNAQDQLVAMPVPEASTIVAGALLLLPFGGGLLRSLRRNKSA